MSLDDNDRRGPIFVERQAYRRRRLLDAARALPVLGVMLWMIPLLWGLPEEGIGAARALIYIFFVWAGLICITAGLTTALGRADRRETDGEDSA